MICECGRVVPPEILKKAITKRMSEDPLPLVCKECKRTIKLSFKVDPSEIAVESAKALGGTGILTDLDLGELKEGERQVAELMSDGAWHLLDEVKAVAGDGVSPASSGDRRMRNLRKIPGVEVLKERVPGSKRLFRYRLVRAVKTTSSV